jgi:hypothetical protein
LAGFKRAANLRPPPSKGIQIRSAANKGLTVVDDLSSLDASRFFASTQ